MNAPGLGRRLRRMVDASSGIVLGLALDHRDSLRAAATERGMADTSAAKLASFKTRVARAIAPCASAVMLDTELGGDAFDVVPPHVGLVMPLEAQGHDTLRGYRLTRLMPDFDATAAAVLGADGCKLVLYYRPDDAPSARAQDALVARAVADCHARGLPLVLEPTVYRLPNEDAKRFGERFASLVVASARLVAPLGADLLKLQFPGPAACAALDAACGTVPWVLLGGGADSATFLSELQIACRAGASGFLVGRSVWGAALVRDEPEQARLIEEVCVPLFARCRTVATASGRPIWERERVSREVVS